LLIGLLGAISSLAQTPLSVSGSIPTNQSVRAGIADPQYDGLYRDLGNGSFERITSVPFVRDLAQKWEGFAWGDYDDDGFLDIFLANASTKRNLLFHNNGNSSGWLVVKCIGGGTNGFSNPDAIGANVRARATFGGSEWTQLRTIGLEGSPGQNDPRAHFEIERCGGPGHRG